MGILGSLFPVKRSKEEKELEESYYQRYRLIGMTRKDIKTAILDCKRKAKLEGDFNMDNNFGVELLQRAEQGDKSSEKAVQNRLNGGANKEDIKEWWSLNYLERRMMKWEDDLIRISAFKTFVNDQGYTEEEAILKLRKSYPIYGDSTDESKWQGDDRPLPDELHDRINQLVINMDSEMLKKESSKFTSMNAYLRSKLNN